MDELENQTICEWRDSERKVTTLKSTLMQIDPRQRSAFSGIFHIQKGNCISLSLSVSMMQ